MLKSKKVTCVVTKKATVYAGDFLRKKIEEYGDECLLDKLYICKEVKALLKKGYKIKDIRKILDVPADTDLLPDDIIKEIEKTYQSTPYTINDTDSQPLSTITSLTYDKSDPDVDQFIHTHIM
jgi:DNA-binding transcriptional MerR regulator